jgi:hypothetical protein
MLLRRETIEQVGGLDETFFMYGEDLDWCYRIKEAGWGIYPVFLFSAFALTMALRHAMKPAREFVPVLVGSSAATLLAGMLGMVTGYQHAVQFIERAPPDRRWLFLVGLREASNNMVAAGVAVVFVCILGTIGSYRLARRLSG